MRAAEGTALKNDLKMHTRAIEKDLERIRDRSAAVVEGYAKRLKKRVDELLADAKLKLDEETLAREVAVFADRSDISEEIARLDSHLQQLLQSCEGTAEARGQAGRRLDFISQEMLREANTIASKASDIEIIRCVVDIKCRIDRIERGESPAGDLSGWVGGRLLEWCTMEVSYRTATVLDLDSIAAFVDFWLTGGGLADGVPGSAHDFFVPVGRHKSYLAKYRVLLAIYKSAIVGWAVKTKKGVLIHLLVAGTFRGSGIGSELLRRMSPDVVRSKFDQSTGDPSGFYLKHGYISSGSKRLGKKQNIDIFTRPGVDASEYLRRQADSPPNKFEGATQVKGECAARRRSIDAMAKKLHLGTFHPERF